MDLESRGSPRISSTFTLSQPLLCQAFKGSNFSCTKPYTTHISDNSPHTHFHVQNLSFNTTIPLNFTINLCCYPLSSSPMAFFFFFFLAPFLFTHLSHSATVIVDGVSQWKNPHLRIGDSVIFHHKNRYNLYIFKSQEAFALCNFTKATLLTNPKSSSYTWHTSRPGNFYFAFKNGANGGCSEGEKFAVKVSAVAAPEPAAEPRPVSGGVVASSPAFPWPFQPRESVSPSPAPALSLTVGAPAAAPDRGGIPFINSNPAVPLPTGEVDSATIRPLPTSSGFQHFNQVVGFGGVAQRALSCCVILVMMMV